MHKKQVTLNYLRRILYILPVLFLFLFSISHSDNLTLNNGKIIEGQIIDRTADSIVIDTGGGVPVTFYLDEVKNVNIRSNGNSDKLSGDKITTVTHVENHSFNKIVDFINIQNFDQYEIGKQFFDNREYPSAIMMLKKVFEEDPTREDLPVYIGGSYFELGDIEQAREYLETANSYASNDSNVDSKVLLAAVYIQEKKFEKAKEYLDQALKINSRFPDVHEYIGIVQLSRSEFQEARDSFYTALELYKIGGYKSEYNRVHGYILSVEAKLNAEQTLEDLDDPTEVIKENMQKTFTWIFGIMIVLVLSIVQVKVIQRKMQNTSKIVDNVAQLLGLEINQMSNQSKKVTINHKGVDVDVLAVNHVHDSGGRKHLGTRIFIEINLHNQFTLYFLPKFSESRFNEVGINETVLALATLPMQFSQFNIYTNDEKKAADLLSELTPLTIFAGYIMKGVYASMPLAVRDGRVVLELREEDKALNPTLNQVVSKPIEIMKHVDNLVEIVNLIK